MQRPEKPSSLSDSTLHHYMMPEHANPRGTIHGGLIMKMMDEAGAIAAMRHAQRPVVTIAVDSMTFKSPVEVGQLLTLQASVTYVGNTSMEVEVMVAAEDPVAGTVVHTNSAYLVYVALDDAGRPCRVPGLVLENERAEQRFAQGEARQKHRTRKV